MFLSPTKKNSLKMKPASASCGLTFHCAEDLTVKLRVMTQTGYDFLVTPIVHPRYRVPEIICKRTNILEGING